MSTSAPCARSIRWSRTGPSARSCRHQDPARGRRRRRRPGRRDQGALYQALQGVIMRRRTLLGAAALLPFGAQGRVGRAAGRDDHAGADRGRQEGRQGLLLHGDGPLASPSRWPRPSRPSSPASRSRSSAPAPSGCSTASPRRRRATSSACDVVNSSDAAHFITWKREGWLQPYVTVDIAENVAGRDARSRRRLRQPAHASVGHGLQYRAW